MRNATTIVGLFIFSLLLSVSAFAQETGDFRSVANGDWSDASTWEWFDGSSWTAAPVAPAGEETITITDTVSVDIAVTVSGYIRVEGTGLLEIGEEVGSLEFTNGSTYEHARDEGSVPEATWGEGSTFLLTGTVQDAPDDTNQDFHHITINTPDLGRNRDLGFDHNTIFGDVRVISTGENRWQLMSAEGGDSAAVNILGDVIVEDGTFAVQGTGNALTKFDVHHYGDIVVTGGNFSAARGSQGSGSGTTTWYLYGGDFTMSDAATQNSNPTPGNAKFVFAGSETQHLAFQNVEYAGGDIHFEVSDSTALEIATDFEINGHFVNRGEVVAAGELTVLDEGVYEHARDGGAMPDITWEEGSTAMFTGVVSDAPENRGQDYHHLVLNTPDMLSNQDLSLDGHTVGGDITVLSSGSSRWRLVGGSSGEVTIMGDLIVQDASFETQGTGSATDVVVHHYGDVQVSNGNFSVSRGSQASGTGTTTWYLYDGDFSLTDSRTQNSNPTPGNAKFVFAEGGVQQLRLEGDNTIDDLSIEVADSTTLDLGASEIEGSGVFILQDGATVLTSHPAGLAGNLQMTGEISLGSNLGLAFGGTEPVVADSLLPDTLASLTISNTAGVTIGDTTYVGMLQVDEGATLVIDSTGSVTAAAGTVDGSIVNRGEIIAEEALTFGATAEYEHARNEGSIPSGVWGEGSTVRITGVVDEAPDNRDQNYHNLEFNTPGQLSNLNMSLDENTIAGDIRVIDTGAARWYLTSASAEDTSTVTLMGDVFVEGGQFSVQGTGNALTTFVVHHYGDVNVTGGNFSIARGSQGGTGTTTWYLHEGDFSMSGATTQNSNSTPGSAKFVFAGSEVQHLMLGEENEINDLPIEVAEGATLDMGTSELGGGDVFILNAGATLATAHEGGVAGAIQTEGDVTLSSDANFTFNGTTAQVTSELMPAAVNDVVIDNEAGVTLTQETTINGVLRLVSGEFDNTIPFTLGPDASISMEGGSLTFPVSAETDPEIPAEFALHQNYPNPFNPSTTIRYDIRERADVSVKIYDVTGREVMELVNQTQAPGSYTVQWNAIGVASGVYYYQIRAGDWHATKSLMLVK